LGHSPLPWEETEKSYGPGIRTWQFAKPLIDDGHEVTIIASRIPFVYEDEQEKPCPSVENGCVIYRVYQEEFERGNFTEWLIGELDPDCIVGATAYPSYVALLYAGEKPVWADIFGSILAEAQVKAAVYADDSYLEHFHRINNLILHTADHYSTVSERQKYELIGQLGVAGRLTSRTLGHEFVSAIPCGIDASSAACIKPLRRDRGDGEFVVLWSGGYNTWTDVKTLFRGLEKAMSISEKVKFISTGGEIAGHDERTYANFVRMVENSNYRDRFELKGWLRKSQVIDLYGQASVGLNIDAVHYEVTFGSRNRILEWALYGIPALTTSLCELTMELEKNGLIFTFYPGDADSLAEKIIELEGKDEMLADLGNRLREFVISKYSFENTTKELREWASDPVHSPDFESRLPMRLQARKASGRKQKHVITKESPVGEKLLFYLRNEGVVSTMRRAVRYISKGISGRSD